MNPVAAVVYAIIVGANTPTGPTVRPLRYADDDAAAYAELLRTAGADVTLLTTFDDDTRALERHVTVDGPATRRALDDALGRLHRRLADDRRAGRTSDVFLVFTGHGDVEHGEGYIQLEGGRLRRGELYSDVLPQADGDRVHVVVDTCKSYFFAFERGGGERVPHHGHFVAAADAERFPQVGFLLSTSSGSDSHEWEQYQGGVFSHEVRSALWGAADLDGSGDVSYAEVGAFVRRANAAIDNPRFRPEFTVVAPRSSTRGPGTPLLAWDRAPATARSVTLDGAPAQLYVEDAAGRRLLDAHPAHPGLVLRLPSRPLFVHLVDDDSEYALPAAADARLSSLERRPSRLAARGAVVESFRLLFREPLDASDVAAYARAMAPPPVDDSDEQDRARTARAVALSTGSIAIAAALAGAGCTLGAWATAQSARTPGRSQADIAASNGRIGALDAASVSLYAVAGAAIVTSVAALLVPRLLHRRR